MIVSQWRRSTRVHQAASIVLLAGAGLLVVSACSSGSTRSASPAGGTANAPGGSGQPATNAPAPSNSSPVTIAVGSSSLGPIVIDTAGQTLYRFAGDQKAGDTTGDGFGGIWHVVHTAASAATSSPAPAATPGY